MNLEKQPRSVPEHGFMEFEPLEMTPEEREVKRKELSEAIEVAQKKIEAKTREREERLKEMRERALESLTQALEVGQRTTEAIEQFVQRLGGEPSKKN